MPIPDGPGYAASFNATGNLIARCATLKPPNTCKNVFPTCHLTKPQVEYTQQDGYTMSGGVIFLNLLCAVQDDYCKETQTRQRKSIVYEKCTNIASHNSCALVIPEAVPYCLRITQQRVPRRFPRRHRLAGSRRRQQRVCGVQHLAAQQI